MSVIEKAKALRFRLPFRFWVPGLYWDTWKLLEQSEAWSRARLLEYQTDLLRQNLIHCGRNVPYYRRLFREYGFEPQSVREPSDIRKLPPLDREQLLENPADFLAENISHEQRAYHATGGTMGRPLGLYNLRDAGWRERAFVNTLWRRVGFGWGDRRAMLKGTVIKSSRHWEYDPIERAWTFSNFHMTPRNVAEYARVMKRKGALYFHTYPSAALDFARLLRDGQIEPPRFRAILAASENLYPGQRELLENFFHCRVFSFYGHSENTVMAGECEVSTNYHIFPEYGLTEIIGDDGRPVSREGESGEIVGTSFYNRVMPLVRYRTGDFAVLGPESCACGRPYPLLKQVLGRWHQEMLIGKQGNLVSITALNFHSSIFAQVHQFQLHQAEKGRVQVRLVRKNGYTEEDTRRIAAALAEKMGDSMEVEFTFPDSIAVTPRGKYRYIVQELELPRLAPGAEGTEKKLEPIAGS